MYSPAQCKGVQKKTNNVICYLILQYQISIFEKVTHKSSFVSLYKDFPQGTMFHEHIPGYSRYINHEVPFMKLLAY